MYINNVIDVYNSIFTLVVRCNTSIQSKVFHLAIQLVPIFLVIFLQKITIIIFLSTVIQRRLV